MLGPLANPGINLDPGWDLNLGCPCGDLFHYELCGRRFAKELGGAL